MGTPPDIRPRLKWGATILLGAVLAAGAGKEIWFCSACDFKGGAHLTLGTLPVVRIGFGLSGADQYGSAALWEDLHGKPCVHVWSRHGDWFFGWLNYRRGPRDAVHFSRGLRVHALRAIGSIDKSWAIAAWDALRTPDASRRERVEAALDRLGEQAYEAALEDRRPPKEGIAAWWESNRKLMAGSNR